MAANFDVLVVGDDAPSLCAAAAAAAAGAKTILAPSKGKRLAAPPSVCDIPNFVWRRLELQDFGLSLEPVSARITLLADGKSTTTYRSPHETATALYEEDPGAASLWPALTEDMRALAMSGLGAGGALTAGAELPVGASLRMLNDMARLSGSSTEMLDDYLNGGPLSTHIGAHALAASGLGGAEAGSAMMLPEFFSEHSWRVRTKPGSRSVLGALRKACEHHGVSLAPKDLKRAAADGVKMNIINFGSEEKIRVREIFFASPNAAETAGYRGVHSALAPYNGARATLRLKLRSDISLPAGDKQAIFQLIDSGEDIRSARESALDGRLSESLPVEFEFTDKGDIVAYTSYIPRQHREDGEWRGWTGQDRQLLSKIMIDRLASRIDGLREKIQKQEISVTEASADNEDPFMSARNVTLQPNRHDAVAAAVALIDKVLAND